MYNLWRYTLLLITLLHVSMCNKKKSVNIKDCALCWLIKEESIKMHDAHNFKLTDLLVQNKRSKIPPWTTMHLTLVCEDGVLVVWVDLHVSQCGQQHPKCEQTVRLVRWFPTFFHLRAPWQPISINCTLHVNKTSVIDTVAVISNLYVLTVYK